MRIVDRKTFLSMPAGTVFAKFSPQPADKSHRVLTHDDLAIKGDTTFTGSDFFVQELFPWFEGVNNSEEHMDTLCAMIDGGASPPLDYDCGSRDGLFDDDQLFAVWDREDHQRLIARLQVAFGMAHG